LFGNRDNEIKYNELFVENRKKNFPTQRLSLRDLIGVAVLVLVNEQGMSMLCQWMAKVSCVVEGGAVTRISST